MVDVSTKPLSYREAVARGRIELEAETLALISSDGIAKGNVFAKTGTFIEGTATGPVFRAQALGGYITAKSGRRLAFALAVNDVGPLTSLDEVLQTFQDQGTIAAIVWRDH